MPDEGVSAPINELDSSSSAPDEKPMIKKEEEIVAVSTVSQFKSLPID